MAVSRRVIATAAALCFATAVVFAQNPAPRTGPRTVNAPPKPTGATPRTADGHPDLTGVWNGLGDNLNGVPNQIANNGIAIESETQSGPHVVAEWLGSAQKKALPADQPPVASATKMRSPG